MQMGWMQIEGMLMEGMLANDRDANEGDANGVNANAVNWPCAALMGRWLKQTHQGKCGSSVHGRSQHERNRKIMRM